MGQVLHRGLFQSREPVGVAVTRVDNELAKVREFTEGDRRGFDTKVLG